LAARIRRAVSNLDVATEPQVHVLANEYGLGPRAIQLARVLAEIRLNGDDVLAQRLGPGLGNPVLSQARFQRLIRSEGIDDRVTALRRVLPMVDRTCNVAALARDFLKWDEATRIDWTFDYYHSPKPNAVIDNVGEKETNA